MTHLRTLVPTALILAGALPVACGGAPPPPPVAPAPSAAPAPPPPVIAAAPSPDLSEAPEPNDLVAIVRWKSPDASVATVAKWTNLPLNLKEVLPELLPDPRFADLVASAASVDVAVALDPAAPDREPQPFAAVSIGLKSLEDARKIAEAKGGATELRPGVFRLGSGRRGRHGHGKIACVIAASVGDTPARLVCGDRDRDVDALAPYLTRTLAKSPVGPTDMHGEVRFAPIEKRYGGLLRQSLKLGADFAPSQIQIGQPAFDRALTDAIQAIVEETLALSTDLDTFSFDATLEPGAAIAAASLRFKDKQSWSAQTMAEVGAKSGPAPAIFWRLPADATLANYGRGADPKRFAGLRQTLSSLADGWLAHEGIPAADRQAITDVFSPKYAGDAATVVATGPLDAAGRASVIGTKPGSAIADSTRNAIASFGWEVVGIDDASDKWIGGVKSVAAAYNRPSLQTYLKKKLGTLDLGNALPTIKGIAAPKGLPAGSYELDVAFTPDAFSPPSASDFDEHGKRKPKRTAAAAPAVHVYLLAMTESGHTWMAFGGERSSLVSHLLAVKAGAPDAGTIAGKAGLESLHTTAAASAGFVTVAGFARSMQSGLKSAMHSSTPLDFERILSGIPHHGETPIMISSTIAGADKSETWSASVRVPQGSIEDAVAMTVQLAAQHSHGGVLAAPAGVAAPPPAPAPRRPPITPPPGKKH